ncbi:hypothetical protein [Sporomusa acidovorans]|uniref:hypothetical protein n=1 Tax=Sporomusa acidovorans TaxID=112900 RepID=UPI0008904E80|nr:hypothetical protein [Sporomusa acidovorans]OZC19082.1 hypothetical protein SPACI_31680 [Sporomusa acidovorans DSM 3132]SDD66637.1 hypothetical protein SAMN04488499_100328 [Sporomusa acidovorans]
MNMSNVSAGGSASGMAGMSGCSGSQHSQMTAGKNTAATEKATTSSTKQLSVDPKLGKTVDISV